MNKENTIVMSQAASQMTIYIILLIIHMFMSTINSVVSGEVYVVEIILMNAIGLVIGVILGLVFFVNWPETSKICMISIVLTIIVYILFTLFSIALYNF